VPKHAGLAYLPVPFGDKALSEAIRKTFQNRVTALPASGTSFAFAAEFYDDRSRKSQWTAFCAKNATYIAKAEFRNVSNALQTFLVPRESRRRKTLFPKQKKPGGWWSSFSPWRRIYTGQETKTRGVRDGNSR
jgi:hypothetical protein